MNSINPAVAEIAADIERTKRLSQEVELHLHLLERFPVMDRFAIATAIFGTLVNALPPGLRPELLARLTGSITAAGAAADREHGA